METFLFAYMVSRKIYCKIQLSCYIWVKNNNLGAIKTNYWKLSRVLRHMVNNSLLLDFCFLLFWYFILNITQLIYKRRHPVWLRTWVSKANQFFLKENIAFICWTKSYSSFLSSSKYASWSRSLNNTRC